MTFYETRADEMTDVASNSVDAALTSNFLEHLKSKGTCDRVFREVLRVFASQGRGRRLSYLRSPYCGSLVFFEPQNNKR